MAGDRLYDDEGTVVGTHGFYVDISRLRDPDQEDLVTAKLAEIAEHRAAIEQAKGMLMLIYGIDEDGAFDLLRWLSQEANVKLRLLAEQISRGFPQQWPGFHPAIGVRPTPAERALASRPLRPVGPHARGVKRTALLRTLSNRVRQPLFLTWNNDDDDQCDD